MQNKIRTDPQIKSFKRLIILLSIVIPIGIAGLFNIRIEGVDFSILPSIYATINGITALVLISAVIAIRNKKRTVHQNLMKTALVLSLTFLILYVLYHITAEETHYGGEYRIIYFTLLISHIFLSVGVVPIVLITYFQAWKGDFKRHKKWAHVAFPLWLYVAITGVVIYLMISPFYA